MIAWRRAASSGGDGAEKLRQAEAGPCLAEDGEAAVVERVVQGSAERGDERQALEGVGDEVAGLRGRPEILQTVRERGPSGVRMDSLTRKVS